MIHYLIVSFLFLGGRFYNDAPPPLMLFIIPGFAVAALTVVVLVPLPPGQHPREEAVRAFDGDEDVDRGGVWVRHLLAHYMGALEERLLADHTLLYYWGVHGTLLLSRQAEASVRDIAFAQGAKAVSRLKALWFRITLHAVFLLLYTVGWCVIYLQLLRFDNEDSGANVALSANTTDTTELAGLQPGATLLPRIISLQIQEGTVRRFARYFMVYNLLVVSQSIKGSVWISVAASAASISEAAQNGSAVRLAGKHQASRVPPFPRRLRASVAAGCERPSAGRGHASQSEEAVGVLFTVGALLHVATRPVISRVNMVGLVDMATSRRNLFTASRFVWEELDAVGLLGVINDDVIFGARVCSSILFASASSVASRILVELFQFPQEMTDQVGTMCFIASFFIGNIGMEAGEAWAVSLHLQYARGPEALYVANPPFA
eukprot:CAMPEP_0172089700 /NCGR_PEP_ID=MMETSP1043-20130122/23951_1 /TAXON_ID=464988 /ORGANISM="Hemiselmis andersenii, Strain CCMP441" /LENGTH=432 /DNA_ID=CAMNT_0012752177 /DNA_START=114 /DNA_END=1410 /DNA_ORIENTATION=-